MARLLRKALPHNTACGVTLVCCTCRRYLLCCSSTRRPSPFHPHLCNMAAKTTLTFTHEQIVSKKKNSGCRWRIHFFSAIHDAHVSGKARWRTWRLVEGASQSHQNNCSITIRGVCSYFLSFLCIPKQSAIKYLDYALPDP
ncbi:unnamed protein product [Ectocarpus sp. 8 AP-2014]